MTSAFRFGSLLLMLAFCTILSGQITADLSGVVTDASGASIAGAKLTVTSKETGEARTLTSDAEGRFAAYQLKIGNYDIKSEAPGFRTALTSALLKSGEISAVAFKMEVGQVTDSVVVTDAVSQLDSSSAQIQISIEGAKIQNIPVGRNALLFATTSPGVVPVSSNNPFLSAGSFNSNGNRGRSNNITVDNITASDISSTGNGGNQIGSLNFASIQEVKVITNNFSAEYGRNAGSQLQFITKSGTNQFHGEAYEYLQNDKLNARDFFDRSGHAAITRYNQFGYVLGGPIVRNKTQFFTSYEGIELRGAGAARIAQVPTPAQLAQVTDPTSKALLAQYNLPAASSIGPDFGTVQQAAGSFTKAPVALSFRIDHQFSSVDSINGRYSQFHSETGSSGNTFISTNIGNFGATAVNSPREANISETHLFSPTIVNEFRFGYGRSSPVFAINSTAPAGPRITFSNAQIDQFGTYNGIPQGRIQNTFEESDTLSWSHGPHNVKFGADIYRYQLNSFLDSSTRGVFTFNSWSDFAAGIPANFSQSYGSTLRGTRVSNQHFFVQDDWKIMRNLTFNIGLRTELTHGATEVNGIISNLNLKCTTPIAAAGTGPLGCFEIGKPSNDSHTNWGPRFGFAWTPFGGSKTVVRGGYGIAYDFLFLNPITNQRGLPPFVSTASLNGQAFTGDNNYAALFAGTARVQQQAAASVGILNPNAKNFGNVNPAIDQALANPKVQHWSLGLEREIAKDIVLKVSYVGTKGDHLQESLPINLINDPRLVAATSIADETARLADFRAVNTAQSGGVGTLSNRIDPRFNQVTLLTSAVSSNYHALEVEVVKSFSQQYFLQVGYTFSKSIDNGSDALGVLINDSNLPQNPRNLRAERGVSQFDVAHRLVITHTWEPKWGQSISNPLLRHVVSGWGFAGLSSFRSGFPVTFESGARRGIAVSTLTGFTTPIHPNASGPVNFNPQPTGSASAPIGLTTDPIAPISAYAASLGLSQPLLGNFGTLGRTTNRLNGETNVTLNVYKSFAIRESIRLQIRAEFYNAFNNVSFQDVNRNIANPAFGQYTTQGLPSRNMQVAARVVF